MNFSKIKSLVIPEGNVIMISHGGLVLWKKRIPSTTYTELDYLEFTGTQWLDTGYKGNTTRTRYETRIVPSDISTTQGLFGSRNRVNVSENDNCLAFIIGDNLRLDWLNGSGANPVNVPATANDPYEISITRSKAYVNGKEYTFTNTTSIEQNNNFLIGSFTNGSTEVYANGFIGKLYYSKLYDNDVLVHDFIPVLDVNNNPCLFDKVTETFFYNKGTGEFKYGLKPGEPELPYSKELEYLESTGTQWIDIGTTVDTSTDEIELCFQLTETAMYKWFFGEYDTNARLGLGSGDGIDKRNFLYKSSTAKISDTDVYNRQHKYLINASGGFIDGVKKVGYDSFSSNSTLYLFNINIDSSSNYNCKAKVWTYKQTRNGVLIRDLIPVLDKNNIPCMYDKVSGEFFYNKGTGEFLYKIVTSSVVGNAVAGQAIIGL